MTGWLSGWLKEIVLILLFATFVDLLMPNHALQRYVKVVVSLIVLLTILSPIIALLRADHDVRQALERAVEPAASGDRLPALSSIVEKGGQLRADAEQRSSALVSEQLSEMIRERIALLDPDSSATVQVGLAADAASGELQIARIRIQLRPSGAGAQPQSSANSRAAPVSVERVEQVRIEPIERGGGTSEDDGSAETGQIDSSSETTRERADAESRIRQELRTWLRVEDRQVEISWLGEITDVQGSGRIGRQSS